MKKILLFLSLLVSLSVEAQYVTTSAKHSSQSQDDKILYYLPKNVIKVDLTIEETRYAIGPYAEYASDLLGINDYVRDNKTIVEVKNVELQTGSEIDLSAAYYISFDEKNKEPMPNIILDDDGVILAFGHENIPSKYKVTRKKFSYDNAVNDEFKVTFIEILDNEIEGEDNGDKKEQKAKFAAEKLAQIKASYMELVSGEQETLSNDVLIYQVDNMKNLEDEYISLFKGKIVKNTYQKTCFITPEKSHANATLSLTKLSNGDQVKIQFDSKSSLANIDPTDDDVKNASQSNKIFYRIPALSNTKISIGSKSIAENQLIISQFGEIKTISPKGNKLLFNPNTGQIVSVTK